jgi:D-sedoheptulose 7-phosphate isomerase
MATQTLDQQGIEKINEDLDASARLKSDLKALAPQILGFAEEMHTCLLNGGKVVLCGNGGAAADAQHIAAELVGMFLHDRRALAGITLTTNPSVVTAVSNDWSFEEVFARQVQALVGPRDLLIGISAGGNSPNVLRAVEEAQKIGARTACLVGKGGGTLAKIVDCPIVVPSNLTPRIQEAHITIGHIACGLVESWVVSGRTASATVPAATA